jgi:anthranilate synthase component 1
MLPPLRVHPDTGRFRALAERSAVVPVWSEWIADDDTPVSCFARLRRRDPSAFLLESVTGGERWARYSFVGVGARARLRGVIVGDRVEIVAEGLEGLGLPMRGDAIAMVRAWMERLSAAVHDELPPFWGGLVGVWGHEIVRAIERLPRPAHHEPSPLPVLDLVLTDRVVVFDGLTQRRALVAAAIPQVDGGVEAAMQAATARIAELARWLHETPRDLVPLALVPAADVDAEVAVRSHAAAPWSRAHHLAAVAAAKAHVAAGDVFQVVLSQVFEQPAGGLDPLDVYRVLRSTNPAPYMYTVQTPAATLVGASPEVLVRVARDRTVTLRPIAGTRPRGRDRDEDDALERELLADPKERAEHLMLIDLGRSDLGRIAAPGSVRLVQSFVVERYSRVMHLVSEVDARLRDGATALDVLVAAFPAGTLSGAPKIRALEIIDALEPAPRGWYGGAVGYLGYDGGADFAICIRSMIAHGDRLRVQAGSGIVYDSIAEAEDAECHAKASAVLRAIALARRAAEEGEVPS